MGAYSQRETDYVVLVCLFHQIFCNPAQSVFGGRQQYGLFFLFFFKSIQCAITATVSSAFLRFSLWLCLEVRLIYSLVLILKHDMFFQCCLVCIHPHHLVPMIQSLYQMLPCFPSAVPEPTSSLLGSVGDMLGWGQNQPEHLANTVALNTVSSNHELARSSGTSQPCLTYMCIMLCGTFWCSLMLLCNLAKRVL